MPGGATLGVLWVRGQLWGYSGCAGSGSVRGWLVIMVWFILVCHEFQFCGGVVQLWFSYAPFRRIMVQQLAACD